MAGPIIAATESDHDSDDTLCGGVEISKLTNTDNLFTMEFLNWKRNDKITFNKQSSYWERYEILEDKFLLKMESGLSYIDNLIAIQAIFPAIEKRTKNSKILKPLNFLIKQVAKVYIIMILIYMKRFLLRLRKINKLITLVKTESRIIKRNFLMKDSNINEYHEKFLKVLYTEKIKAIIEIVGYLNDLLLNLSLVTKRFKLGKLMGKFVGFISWIVNMYRLCRDESQDIKNENMIKELQVRFGV